MIGKSPDLSMLNYRYECLMRVIFDIIVIVYLFLSLFLGLFNCPRDETPKCIYNVIQSTSLYYSRPPWSLDIYFDDDRIFVMFSYLNILSLSTFVIYPLIYDVIIKIYIYMTWFVFVWLIRLRRMIWQDEYAEWSSEVKNDKKNNF